MCDHVRKQARGMSTGALIASAEAVKAHKIAQYYYGVSGEHMSPREREKRKLMDKEFTMRYDAYCYELNARAAARDRIN